MKLSSGTKLRLSLIRSVCKNENGAVLVVGLMFIAILAMLGTTAVVMTTTDMQIGANYKTSVQASNVAQAGVSEAIYRLGLFDDGGTNAPPSGSMININGLTDNNAAISLDPNGLLSNGIDDDGNGAVDDISDLNFNGAYDNRNWQAKIMLSSSAPAGLVDNITFYTNTIQPSGNWIEYSSSTDDGTALTIEFEKDTNDIDSDGNTSEIVFYDENSERALDATYPYNVQGLGGKDASGQPIVVITSTGRSGSLTRRSTRTMQVGATYQPIDITAESAVMVNMDPALGAAIVISGFNYEGTVALGDENLPPPNNRWLRSSDGVLAGVDYTDQAAVIAAFRANAADNYGGGNQTNPIALKVPLLPECPAGSEFCAAYPTAPWCVGGDPAPPEYSSHPVQGWKYNESSDYDTDLLEWAWCADDCSIIGVNREDSAELDHPANGGVPYGAKLKTTGHKPGIWSTVDVTANANNISVFGGNIAGTTNWLSESNPDWLTLHEMLGFATYQDLYDAVLAYANVTVADQDAASGKLEAAPQGVIYIDNAGGNALDIAAATPGYGDGWGLMYITGDVSISTAGFQFKGLVYVEGDLSVSGSPLFVGCLAVKGAAGGAGITGSPHLLYSYDALNQYTNRGMKFITLFWKDEGVS